MRDKAILDEKVIFCKGPLQRIKRWWKGIHPDRGTVVQGWTGLETVEEKDRIVPERVFTVDPVRDLFDPLPDLLGVRGSARPGSSSVSPMEADQNIATWLGDAAGDERNYLVR